MTTKRKPSPYTLRIKKTGATLVKVSLLWDSKLKQAAEEFARQETERYGTSIGVLTLLTNFLMYDPKKDPEIREQHVAFRSRYRKLIESERSDHVQEEDNKPRPTEFR